MDPALFPKTFLIFFLKPALVARRSSLPKISHTYPIMMNLGKVIPYLKKIQKDINQAIQPLNSTNRMFSSEISNFCYIKK